MAAALLLLAGCAMAEHYRFRHYGLEEGLNTAVSGLLQDHTGYIWVGTGHGLFRYDGTRFQGFGTEDGLPSTSIRMLQETPDGVLWVATGRGLARFRNAAFEKIPLDPHKVGSDLHAIAAAGDGRLFVASERGVFVTKPEQDVSRTVFREFAGAPAESSNGVWPQSDGSVWFNCGLRLCLIANGRLRVYGQAEGLPPDRWGALLRDPEGALWVRGSQHLSVLPAGAQHFVARDFGLPQSSNSILSMIQDRRGQIFVATDVGVARWSGGQWNLIGTHQGLDSDAITSILEDREGAIWIGMWGAGVARWAGNAEWTNWTTADGLSNNVIWAIRRQTSGSLQIGTDRGLVEMSQGEVVKVLTKKDGLGGDKIKALTIGPSGELWVACLPGGISRIDPRGKPTRTYGPSSGLLDDRVVALYVDVENRLWASTGTGLFRSTGLDRNLRFERQTPPGTDNQTMFFRFRGDSHGGFWLCSASGLYRWDRGQWTRFTTSDGMKANAVTHVAETSDGSVWFSYRDPIGMSRFTFSDGKPHAQHFTKKEGLPTDYIVFLGIDAGGRLWVGTDNGAAVRSGEAWHVYTHDDGLVWDDFAANAFWGDDDGSVWLGTLKGLSHFSPQGQPPPSLAPPAVITSVRFAGRPADASAYRKVAFREHDFLVSFSGLSFQSEKNLQFRYRLAGLDQGWVETSAREARYPSLPAGAYRFQVAARNPSGPWSEAAASFSFRVIPPWWQTWIFRLGAAAVLLALAGWVYRIRMDKMNSEHRKLELAVRERTTALKAQNSLVERQKGEIEDLLRQSQEASRLKSEFLANMSHEIRTPMNGVLGMTQLILNTQLDEEQRDYIGTVRESAESLLVVIDDILDFSKIEAGKLELSREPFLIPKCVADAAQFFAWKAQEKGIVLSHEVAPEVPEALIGDADRLRQVLLNLMGNAMKFTERGSVSVEVSLTPDGPKGGNQRRLLFSVRDTGSGIPYDKQAMIFDAFAQADGSRRRRQGGTGLGLAICTKLVHLMKGSIWVESTPSSGSRFAFTALLEKAASGALSGQSESKAPLGSTLPDRPLRILLAEDNAVNQRLARIMLERLGHSVAAVENGRQAVDAVDSQAFDVILMDVQMPEMDGFEATAEIRRMQQASASPRVPIVALTAHAMSGDRDQCLQAGMDGFLAKPFQTRSLVDILNQVTRDHPVTLV
jgi:signal transduction histidine kinase/ActR/RegA family two-component response regulator/streptogramin lyase